MTLESILFFSLSALVVGCALLVVTLRNPVHSAIFLIGTLLNMAGLYLLLDAEFLVGVQVIVYVGGITVLYLFVMSLISLKNVRLESAFTRQKAAALAVSALLLAEVGLFLWKGQGFFQARAEAANGPGIGTVEAVGRSLFGEYVLPFEIATVVLLVAIVGAVLMSRKPSPEEQEA